MPTKKRTSKSLTKECDRLFSLIVRARGYCELAAVDGRKCEGFHQCAHVVSRKYFSTRWSKDNAFCLCQGHHTYYTHHPEAWFLLVENMLPGHWTELWRRAQAVWDKSHPLAELQEELAGVSA